MDWILVDLLLGREESVLEMQMEVVILKVLLILVVVVVVVNIVLAIKNVPIVYAPALILPRISKQKINKLFKKRMTAHTPDFVRHCYL